jgi:membrane protein DedA with SNARE-associated domain
LSLSSEIFTFVIGLVEKSGYAGVFALMALANSLIPIPSEVILPVSGYLVYLGKLNFTLVLVVSSVASLIGTLVDYWIGLYLGRAAILRYGKYVRLNENHLKTSEKWFGRYGEITVLLLKFVPLVRVLVAFPAGFAEMKLWKFILFSIIGIVIYGAILIYIGEFFGANYTSIVSSLSNAFLVIEILAVVVAAVVLFLWFRRKAPQREKVTP